MSTMYDALRKAEAERKKTGGLVAGDSNEFAPKPGIPDSVKTIALIIAVVCVFAFAYYRFSSAAKQQNSKQTAAVKKETPAAPVAPQVSIPPAAVKQRAPGTYGVDGIIDAGIDSMAIINGKLLKVEDAIDHLILKRISPKEVELLNTKDNSVVVLKLN